MRARQAAAWAALVNQLIAQCAADAARDRLYWAQQLAYGPVLVHALALRLRHDPPDEAVRPALLEVLRLARAGLGTLPERPGISHRDLARLAQRQATALALGRRQRLDRLIARLDRTAQRPAVEPEVPSSMLRAYSLIGWDGCLIVLLAFFGL